MKIIEALKDFPAPKEVFTPLNRGTFKVVGYLDDWPKPIHRAKLPVTEIQQKTDLVSPNGNGSSPLHTEPKLHPVPRSNGRNGEIILPLMELPLQEKRPLVGRVRTLPSEESQIGISPRINNLVAQASEGLEEAFGELYQIYCDKIYNYIYHKTGHSVDAEDLTAQVFIKAWEAIRRYKFEGKPFAAWLFKVARNAVIDHYRTRKTYDDLSLYLNMRAHEGDPEAFAQRRATAQVLMTAIRRLTDEQTQVILLKFVDGMDNKEISATMDKKEEAIRALQYRALLALNRILQDERYGLERTPRNGSLPKSL